MNKFILKKERDRDNGFDLSNVTVDFEAEILSDILEEMKLFLKCCGFHIDDILYTTSPDGEPISANNSSTGKELF